MTPDPDNAGREQVGRFAPGCSGDPAGISLAPGTAPRASPRSSWPIMPTVVKAVVAAAKDGDMTAARLVLDRIASPCRGRPVRLNLPPIVSAADLVRALAARISKTGTCNTTTPRRRPPDRLQPRLARRGEKPHSLGGLARFLSQGQA
jgi:hypothetical protein